jgi:hypothetical protein
MMKVLTPFFVALGTVLQFSNSSLVEWEMGQGCKSQLIIIIVKLFRCFCSKANLETEVSAVLLEVFALQSCSLLEVAC